MARRSAERAVRFDRAALRAFREERGLSQEALAARVGINRERVNDYENGRVTPGVESLFSMAVELGVDPLELTFAAGHEPTLPDLRLRAGLSKASLAAAVGVTVSTVDAWERGRRDVNPTMAARVAVALGVTPEGLADVLRRGHEERRQAAPADNDPGWLRTVATLTDTEPAEQ